MLTGINVYNSFNHIKELVSNRNIKIEQLLLLFVVVFGVLIMFIPMHIIIFALFSLMFLIFLFLNPKYSLCLVIFTLPFTDPFTIAGQELPLNQTDFLIYLLFASFIFNYIILDKKANLRTPIDKWFIVLLIFYVMEGLISISHRGYQGIVKYFELIIIYYLTVYLIRTRTVSISKLLKTILFTGLFQSIWGILQSITGRFGANWIDGRGYLGYLGIGSPYVWHGKGSFWHFNSLGTFLTTIIILFTPVSQFLMRNSAKIKIISFILIYGLILTYSRNGLLNLVILSILFLFITQKNKMKLAVIVLSILAPMFLIYLFLSNTSYISTLNPRNELWEIAYATITQNPKTILIGEGLRSMEDAIKPFIPGNVLLKDIRLWQPHSFYLVNIIEFGVLGSLFIFTFYLANILNFCRKVNHKKKFIRVLNMSGILVFTAIFTFGIFDMFFNQFYAQVLIFIILGLIYAKDS